jgi:plastocyanin
VRLFLVAASALILVSACSALAAPEPATVSAGVQSVRIRVENGMQFSPAAISVQAGQPVELTLENVGGMIHDFTLSDGVAEPVMLVAAGGQQATAKFTIQRPGSYTFTCAQPGHGLAGMRGTIVAR